MDQFSAGFLRLPSALRDRMTRRVVRPRRRPVWPPTARRDHLSTLSARCDACGHAWTLYSDWRGFAIATSDLCWPNGPCLFAVGPDHLRGDPICQRKLP